MQENHETHNHVVKSATYMALGTLSSRVLGLARDALLGAFFSRTITDAWLVAFRIPNLFRRLFGEGALSVSFIPIFMEVISHPDRKKNRHDVHLMAGVFSVLFLVLSLVTLLGILFAGDIVFLIAGEKSFLNVPGKFLLTVQFAKIMFIFCLFVTMYAYFMAILNALKKFALPAFAPVFFNLAMIVCALLAGPLHFSVMWLAVGVSAGGFLQMAILIPALQREKSLPQLTLHFWSDDVARVFRKMLPGFLSLGVMQLGLIINTRFASSLEEGANSWLYWSDRILELPLSLFAVSLGTALLPTLAQMWVGPRQKEMSVVANHHLRLIFLVSVPCAVGLFCLAGPIAEVLFLRGKFNEHDLINVASILQIYSVGILSFGGIRVMAPSFFAAQNTWYPALVAVLVLSLHVWIAKLLMLSFGVQGLAAASMVSSFLNFLFLALGFMYFIGPMMWVSFLKSLAKYIFAAFLMALSLQIYFFGAQILPDVFIVKLLNLFVTILIGVAVYFVTMSRMRSPEYEVVFGNLKRKFRV